MIPTTQVYPIVLSNQKIRIVKEAVSAIFKNAGVRFGEYNIEMYFDKYDRLFVIEINVRQGGNGIPRAIYQHSNIDFTKLLVTLCVGDEQYWYTIKEDIPTCKYICRHPIYSTRSGIFRGVDIEDPINQYVKCLIFEKKEGDMINACTNALDVIGFVDIEFTNRQIQLDYYDKLTNYIKINIE